MDYDQLPRSTLIRMLQEHEAALREAGKDGIVMSYTGRTAPWQIIRQVKPKLSKIVKKHSVGDESHQAQNELWDGENLSTMVTLYVKSRLVINPFLEQFGLFLMPDFQCLNG
jgi:adenine-specific DNA-methyltransferase